MNLIVFGVFLPSNKGSRWFEASINILSSLIIDYIFNDSDQMQFC